MPGLARFDLKANALLPSTCYLFYRLGQILHPKNLYVNINSNYSRQGLISAHTAVLGLEPAVRWRAGWSANSPTRTCLSWVPAQLLQLYLPKKLILTCGIFSTYKAVSNSIKSVAHRWKILLVKHFKDQRRVDRTYWQPELQITLSPLKTAITFKMPSLLSKSEKDKFCFLSLLIFQVGARKNLRTWCTKFGQLFLCSHTIDHQDNIVATKNTPARKSCNIISMWRDSPYERNKRRPPGFYQIHSAALREAAM